LVSLSLRDTFSQKPPPLNAVSMEQEMTIVQAFGDLVDIVNMPQAVLLGLFAIAFAILLHGIFS